MHHGPARDAEGTAITRREALLGLAAAALALDFASGSRVRAAADGAAPARRPGGALPVLLDTDIGSDIDDALALSYLLRQPRCELLGITTVTGEADRRAMLADALCRAAGRPDVPIHVGVGPPLLIAARQPLAQQYAALSSRWPHRSFAARPTAIDFLRETIRARPGEITLLTIGPLTNIGLLFASDPETPTLLKQVVMMAGRYHSDSSARYLVEWNVLCDPHAAAIVFNAPVPKSVAVGLDVTQQCRMPRDEARRRFAQAGGPLDLVAALAEVWFQNNDEVVFHDPLAATLPFAPDLCGMQSQSVEIELTSPRMQGQTIIVPDGGARRHDVATTVDPQAFLDHYFGVVDPKVPGMSKSARAS